MKKLLYSGLMALMMLFAMPGIVRAEGEGETGGETGGETTTPTKLTLMVMSGNDDQDDPIFLKTDESNEVARYMALTALLPTGQTPGVSGPDLTLAEGDGEAGAAGDVVFYYTFDNDVTLSHAAYKAQTDGKILRAEDPYQMGANFILTNTDEDNVILRVIACMIQDGAEVTEMTSDIASYTLTFTAVTAPTFAQADGAELEIGEVATISNAPAMNSGYAVYSTDGTTLPTYMNQGEGAKQYSLGISIKGEVGSTMKIMAINYMDDGEVVAGSKIASVTYTVKTSTNTFTFAPAATEEVAANDAITVTASKGGEAEGISIYYKWFATADAATAAVYDKDAEWDAYSEDSKPQATVALPVLKVVAVNLVGDVINYGTASYTVTAAEEPEANYFSFNPAAESELEENAQINITWSGSNFDIISFKWFATKEAADADETKVGSAAGWTEYAVQNASKIPVFTAANPVLKVIVTNDDEEFLADTVVVYTLKTTPVDPDKLDVKIEFMTDAYGQARFAKKSDKIRLYMEDPDAVDSMMYAVVAIDADGEETAAATYAKYGEALISLADVEGNFRVKAYAMKDTKTSDVFNADYVLLDIINPTLTFDTMTGKNYPVAFDVHSISYPDIMEKDMYVYYSVDGTTEPSDTAFLNGNTALTYLNREEGLWKNFLNLQENTTVWAKAYVLLDEGANLVMETPAVKQLVKMNTLANPVITPAIAATEYNAGDSIKVAIQMPEGAEVVYYTVDGSEPLYSRLVENERLADSIIFMYESWMDHFDTIVVKKSTTIKAIAYKEPAYRPFEPAAGSDIVSATYGFKATLSFNPTSGSTVEEGTKVAITSEDETIDIFYMMFESEEAAKAAEWDQEKAESYNNELQPVLTPKNNTIKAAYARHGAEAIVENYFYATYTVTELPDITLTFNPASGSEVKDSTEITVTASRETEIFYLVYADSAASVADTLFDRNAKEVAENGKPMITKGNTFLKCAVYNKGEMKYFYASYTVKEEGPTAIEAGELAGVNVYPNPNAGAFNVAVPERALVEIFGLNGAKVMSREVNAGVEAFNLDHSGIYFIRVMAGNKTAVKRVVVR